MITVYQFLDKLNSFYPSNEQEEVFKERCKEYSNIILEEEHKNRCKYDYDKVFKHIMMNYKYKAFPSLPDILEALPEGLMIEESYSGREGEVIKRVVNGYEYEFMVVPNHWNKVKTISELDEDIAERTKEIA